MNRKYEIVYIFDSTLEEAQVNEHLDRFHALLKTDDNPDPVTNANHWGKRTLAYPIKGREVGYYVVVQFATDPQALVEFERLIKLEEVAIRYQLVVNEGEVPSPPRIQEDDEKGSREDRVARTAEPGGTDAKTA